MKKYYNSAPIEVYQNGLSMRTYADSTLGLVYCHCDEFINSDADPSIELPLNDETFNELQLKNVLNVYPHTSLITTYCGRDRIEPIFVITCIADANRYPIEPKRETGVDVESYQIPYQNWIDNVIEYTLIRPKNLIEFIIKSIDIYESSTKYNTYDGDGIDIVHHITFVSDQELIEEEIELLSYENKDNYICIENPETPKEIEALLKCQELFRSATFVPILKL